MKLTLIEVKKEAKNTKTFFWKTKDKINFKPGQYMYFTLPKLNYPDKRGATRHFTISSSPTEKYVSFTTRIREKSGFKKTIDTYKKGQVVKGEGPTGTFIIDEKEKGPHVFITGGIGITPFRCALKYRVDKKIKKDVHLIYSDKTIKRMAFYKELEKWNKKNDNIKIDFTLTEEKKKAKNFYCGRINKAMIKEVLNKKELSKATFWVTGPPPMVGAIENLLEDMITNYDRIRTEKFTGY